MGLLGSKEIAPNGPEAIQEIPIERDYGTGVVQVGSGSRKLRIVCLSDTHTHFRLIPIPPADVFLFAGDFGSWRSGIEIVRDFNQWLGSIPIQRKIVVFGNHENSLCGIKPEQIKALLTNCEVLIDSETAIGEGIRVYGAPWTIQRNIFYRAKAYSVDGKVLARKWQNIPTGIDILLTHVPIWGICDEWKGHLGSMTLRNECCSRIHPKVCVFGHHHMPGMVHGQFSSNETPNGNISPSDPPSSSRCLFINCSMQPTIFDYKY